MRDWPARGADSTIDSPLQSLPERLLQAIVYGLQAPARRRIDVNSFVTDTTRVAMITLLPPSPSHVPIEKQQIEGT